MKRIGILIGSLVAVTASASVCDSPACPTCESASNSIAYGGLAMASVLAVAGIGRKAFKARRGGVIAILTLLVALTSNSFAADKTAASTNATPVKVTVGELLAKPDAYAGKQVTVKARLAEICASDGCLTLKDKFDVIEGLPPEGGFKKNPKVGSTLNVTGTVKVKGEGKDKVVAITVKSFEEAKK